MNFIHPENRQMIKIIRLTTVYMLFVYSHKTFRIGGWIGEDIGDSIENYDPISKKWQIVDKLPEPRFSMGVVSHVDKIFCVV